MTTYKQNTPEQIWVSRAIYQELLTALDPFTGYLPITEQTPEPVRNMDCPHFQLASYGCENCFASHEEIASEARLQDQEDWASFTRV
jgi:hypothetical protein